MILKKERFDSMFNGFVKSRKTALAVIPAKAGIQSIRALTKALDSGFHRSDGFLRIHHVLVIEYYNL